MTTPLAAGHERRPASHSAPSDMEPAGSSAPLPGSAARAVAAPGPASRRLAAGLGATYRIQLQPAFGFADAAAMVPDLARLGIETVYTSPITEAVPGSTHGYDGTDPTSLRAELGGADGFAALLEALAANGLGLCVDVVPNHLAADVRGPWWRDVLARGRESEFAAVFDIAWDSGPPEAQGKVSLPVLDRRPEEAIAAGLLTLAPPAGGGPGTVLLVGGELPLKAGAAVGDDPAEVLAAQHYRLIDWRDPHRDYRRFFDIDGLVGVRVEDEQVFERTHGLILELARRGELSAIRVDHLDGLADPATYLRRLVEATGGLPVVIEKILTGDERLRTSWPVAGTTGYEVLDDIGGALVDAGGIERLLAAARAEGEEPVEVTAGTARRQVIGSLFSSEIERVAGELGVDADVLAEVTARLPVYRTYLDGGPVHPDDAAAIETATSAGTSTGHSEVRAALEGAALEGGAPLPAVLRYQQLTGAIMAKGVEDTAWYRLAGPLAFCEVGGDPGRERRNATHRLHERAALRAAEGRCGLIPWTTHDTKRGGDVRARLYALSELSGAFERGLEELRRRLEPVLSDRPATSWQFETRVLAQLALATLPAEGEDRDLGDRVASAMVKGAREAKLETSWVEPDEEYERSLAALAAEVLSADAAVLRAAFGDLVVEAARLGALNSLAGVVLRSALPGVPDCYQADESWNLVLVDPDNRRPPDPAQLRRDLERLGRGAHDAGAGAPTARGRAAQLRRSWRDGRVKVLVTAACLRARTAAPGPFATTAGYVALEAAGGEAECVLACYRSGADGTSAVAVVSRLGTRLPTPAGDLPAGVSYAGTVIDLPGGAKGRFVEAISGRTIVTEGRLDVCEVLAELPVALLVSDPAPD